jgi:hypothetical protein
MGQFSHSIVDQADKIYTRSEQHWSLLPLHAFASTIRPASMIYGPMRSTGGGGPGAWGPSFPQYVVPHTNGATCMLTLAN